jgi:hypothetical protein
MCWWKSPSNSGCGERQERTMDLVLVSITAVSLALAIAMGLIVLKLLAEERRRSDARVALLEAAAVPEPEFDPYDPLSPADLASRLREDAPTGDLFAVPDAQPLWGRRLGVAAAVAVVLVAGAYAAAWIGGGDGAGAAQARGARPLELLALTHVQEEGVLRISGTVHNPRGGSAVTQVSATAVLLAADGTFLASGRGALDYATLAPGDESQFVVAVPVKGPVGRYRVGFRGADGSVVAHVDRRGGGQSARILGTEGSRPWAR